MLPKEGLRADEEFVAAVQARRCNSKGRGAVYDSKAGETSQDTEGALLVMRELATYAGITCHFCRQKKLCGEADCPRCSARDPDLACIGKHLCGCSYLH